MKKGFTLVEVLAIVVILGIIAVLVFPKINTGVSDKKQKQYDKLVEIIENAGKSYLSSHPTEAAVEINTLLSNNYLTSNIIDPFTNSNITGCISKKVIAGINKYEYGNTCAGNVYLTVDLDGGTIDTNQSGEYLTGGSITLTSPEKTDLIFLGWNVEEGNSTISGNTLIIGTASTTIKAIWGVELFVNLDGGSIDINLASEYAIGSIITLSVPTKSNYIFTGWEIIGNSTISGNTLIIGTTNTTIKAIWKTVVKEYAYTGEMEEFIVPKTGTYKIELWGAQGGCNNRESYALLSRGAYTSGLINLNANEIIYVYVGQKGTTTRGTRFNGGGTGGYQEGSNSGGGGTDIRYNGNNLKDRIMVAGGGGGAGLGEYSNAGQGCHGGALKGLDGTYYSGHGNLGAQGRGGSQTAGGSAGSNIYSATGTNYAGTFGIGGNSMSTSSQVGAGGGGGGYYGGGAAGGTQAGGAGNGAGGGSSFISGYTGCVAVTSAGIPKSGCSTGTTNNSCSIHYSGKVFTDSIMIAGNASMPTFDGTSTMTGNNSDGYAKITYVGSE